MPADQPTLKLTHDDYVLIPEDGKRHEIIDGEEYVSPAPKPTHQRTITRLLARMHSCVERAGEGEVLAAPFDVILLETDVVQPDVLYISEKRLVMLDEERGLLGAPDLVIEVHSESNRRHDEIRKRKLYEKSDVQECWIADPALAAGKVYRREGEPFVRAEEVTEEAGDLLATPLLPGFECPLNTLFP